MLTLFRDFYAHCHQGVFFHKERFVIPESNNYRGTVVTNRWTNEYSFYSYANAFYLWIDDHPPQTPAGHWIEFRAGISSSVLSPYNLNVSADNAASLDFYHRPTWDEIDICQFYADYYHGWQRGDAPDIIEIREVRLWVRQHYVERVIQE